MWYYKDEDREIGPITGSSLKELLKAKKINGRTLVRNDSDTRWIPLAQRVAKKAQAQKVSPPATEQAPSPQPSSAPSLEAQEPQVQVEPEPEPGPEATPEPVVDVSIPQQPLPKRSQKRTNFPFTFTGNGSEYFKIWIVNIVLTILTLGIYSAWAKVRKKQYFYGNTKVHDTSFSYLADPITILKGRIVVFGVFVIYSIMESFNPYIALAIAVAVIPLLPLFIVRALKFNAKNSAARNIRFNFHGTYMEAAKAFLFWPILIPFTLGLIFPFVYFKQKQFIVDHSSFGTSRFSFTAQPGDYYRIYLKLILPAIGVAIVGVIANYLFTYSSILITFAFYLYAVAYVAVKNTNLFYNSAQLGQHSFTSRMETKEYLTIFATNTLATILTAGLFFPVAEIRVHKYQVEQLSLNAAGDLDQFVADEKQQVSALGDEAAEFFDLDIGI